MAPIPDRPRPRPRRRVREDEVERNSAKPGQQITRRDTDSRLFGVERGCLGVGVEVPGMI